MESKDISILHGNALKAQREKLGVNRVEAAKRCLVPYSTYEKWERGTNPIRLQSLLGCLILMGTEPNEVKEIGDRLRNT